MKRRKSEVMKKPWAWFTNHADNEGRDKDKESRGTIDRPEEKDFGKGL
jgi:hypothetical protein